MKRTLLTRPWIAVAIAAVATLTTAQIQRLDLSQMVSKSDNAVIGTIIGSKVIRIDHPKDGPELYFTTLTIQGRSLVTGQNLNADITFAGGFTDAVNGVYNSEAPSADDTRIGNQVVAFYKWTPNMGGDLAANSLVAAHGGLYRTFENRRGATIVQGRGEGYAVTTNVELEMLGQQISSLARGPQPK